MKKSLFLWAASALFVLSVSVPNLFAGNHAIPSSTQVSQPSTIVADGEPPLPWFTGTSIIADGEPPLPWFTGISTIADGDPPLPWFAEAISPASQPSLIADGDPPLPWFAQA